MRGTLLLLIWAWSAVALCAPHEHKPPVVLAPGYAPLSFTPPEPGSYDLPAMGSAGDGAVIDPDFGTVDVCIVLSREQIDARYGRHYRGARKAL